MTERDMLIALCERGTADPELFTQYLQRAIACEPSLIVRISSRIGLPPGYLRLWAEGVTLPPTPGFRRFILSLCADALYPLNEEQST
jgi:hypothetical protein